MEEAYAKISDILAGNYTGKKVKVRGWVHRARSSGGLAFVVVRDGTGVVQCAVKKDAVGEKAFADAGRIYVESSVKVEGEVKEDKRAPGGYELAANDFSIVSLGEAFPIAKDQSTEFLLDTRHLWLRSQRLTAIMQARDHIVRYLREFFFSHEFKEFAPPIITKAGCEGGATLFPIKYFDEEAYLTQSGQLYAEVFIYTYPLVFILAPSFRMEPSRTVRHLAEYWHLEPEMAWYDQKMNMELQEKMIEFVCQKMANEHTDLLEVVGRQPEALKKIKAPFDRMTYTDAIDWLKKKGMKVEWGDNLGVDEENALTKELDKPVFVHNYPTKMRSFYMREDVENKGTVLDGDMLAPEGHGEIIGGSERIWELDELLRRMKEEKLQEKDYAWYVDLRRYGSVPHSGFGLGIERLVKWVMGLDHIRDTIPFPRVMNRVYP
ncbi:MAG: asparagine--tRNA ligase [Candidatus Burarchaeum sp.]|nr:asparagine--tRNA ligase [Candidatus Burarchaeum sp.]MDO8339253.1 asparagine--tRNA ligase [Candidatus Burarchaeum sp.]